MITIEKTLNLPDTYPLTRIGPTDSLLFFDIETTGLSADYSNLYLIGCTYFKEGAWRLIQWFAEETSDECQLLEAFFTFAHGFHTLVHFNGDGFDIPFLTKRCERLGLPYGFSGLTSYDIYKKIKPYRYLLGLENLKQKSIEAFLHVARHDQYNGGQLIAVYQAYLHSKNQDLYKLLILHNEEDLTGMPQILPILYYPDFFEHDFTLEKQEIAAHGFLSSALEGSVLRLTCASPYNLPIGISRQVHRLSCKAAGHELLLEVGLYEGTLKHFYPNYKDYYYLIYEDEAIHKSVGEYVDKSAKRQAVQKDCYTKKEGLFIPQFAPLWNPSMKEEWRSKLAYVEYKETLLSNPSDFHVYTGQLIKQLMAK